MQDLLRKKIYKAKVVTVKHNKIVVNANMKCLYFVNTSEFNEEELKNLEGKEIYIHISNLDPIYNKDRIASFKRAKNEILWAKVVDARKTKSNVNGKILNATRGGYAVLLEIGVNSFLPTSHISEEASEADLVGKTLEFKIIGTNKLHRNIIISRKEFILEQLEDRNKEKIGVLSSGVIISGIIKSISEHGLFVSIGYGYSATVPSSEAIWGCNIDLNQVYHVGQHLEAMVSEIDSETKRVILSINKTLDNPFSKLEKGLSVKATPIHLIRDSSSDSSSYHSRYTVIYKTVENSLMCRISSEDDRYEEQDNITFINEKAVLDITIKGVDAESRLVIGSTKRSKREAWDSFLSAYNAAYDKVLQFKVKGKSKFMLFLSHEDYETVLTINEVDYKNTFERFSEIKIGDSILCKILHVDFEEQKSYLSRRSFEEEKVAGIIDELVTKGTVSCKALYRLGYRKFVVSIEEKIEVVVDSSRFSETTLASLQDDLESSFVMAIESYQADNHHLDISEHKIIREAKAKKNTGLNVKDIMISDLIENFSQIISEIEEQSKTT